MHIIHGITIFEIVFLVCAVVFILFPFAVVAVMLILDKIIE